MSAIALDVHSRSVVLDGRPFGTAGAYEKVVGTLRFAVDPAHRLHAAITDLDRAPRNAQGRVEFQGDFSLLRPVDPGRGIAERYASRAAYLEAGRAAAERLLSARHALAEDVEAMVERAGRGL